MGSIYYTEFTYKASGLPQILSEFRAAAKEIEATSKSMGKINFIVNDTSLKEASVSAQALNKELQKLSASGASALNISGDFSRLETVLVNIDRNIANLSTHLGAAGAASARLGEETASAANTGAASLGRMTTAVNTTQGATTRLDVSLKGIGGSISSSASAFTGFASSAARSFASATSEAIKFAATMTGAVTGSIERAAGAMGGLGMAAARMGTAGLATALSGPKNAAMWAAPMSTSLASTLLSPEVILGAGSIASLYTASNLEKIASTAAAKSGAYIGGTGDLNADKIKQLVIDVAQSFAGKSVYTPNQVAQGEQSYAAMGGKLTDVNTTKGVMQNTLDFAQAVTMDVAPAMELLYSQALNWAGFQTMQGPQASAAIQKQADMLTVLSNQTRLNADDLSNALKSVTSVASTSGMSQAQTYAAVGTMSQLGRNPEQAGTDIRRLMLRLTPSYNSLQQQEADEAGLWTDAKGKEKDLSALNEGLKQIGLTYKDINLETTKGDLVGSIQKIDKAMNSKGWDKLTQESFLKTLLGVQGTTPFYLLGQESGKNINADLLSKEENSQGAAARGAATATDNFWGSIKKLWSNVEGTANEIGVKLIPKATDFINYINDSALPALKEFGSILASGDWSKIGDTFKGLIDQFQNGAEGFSNIFKNYFTGGAFGKDLQGATDWVKGLWNSIDWDQAGRTWDNLRQGLESAFTIVAKWLEDRVNEIPWATVETKLENAFTSAGNWLQTKIEGINWDAVGTKLGQILTGMGSILEKALRAVPWASIASALGDALSAIVVSIKWDEAITNAFNVGVSIGAQIVAGIMASDIPAALGNIGVGVYNAFVPMLQSMAMAVTSMKQDIMSIPDKISNFVKNPLGGGSSDNLDTAKGLKDTAQLQAVGGTPASMVVPQLGESNQASVPLKDYPYMAGILKQNPDKTWTLSYGGQGESNDFPQGNMSNQDEFNIIREYQKNNIPLFENKGNSPSNIRVASESYGVGGSSQYTSSQQAQIDKQMVSAAQSLDKSLQTQSVLGEIYKNYSPNAPKITGTGAIGSISTQSMDYANQPEGQPTYDLGKSLGDIGSALMGFANSQAGISKNDQGQSVFSKYGDQNPYVLSDAAPITDIPAPNPSGINPIVQHYNPDTGNYKPAPGTPENPIVVDKNPQIDDTNKYLKQLPQDLRDSINKSDWGAVSAYMGKAAGYPEGTSTISADTAKKYNDERGSNSLAEILASALGIKLAEPYKYNSETAKNTKESADNTKATANNTSNLRDSLKKTADDLANQNREDAYQTLADQIKAGEGSGLPGSAAASTGSGNGGAYGGAVRIGLNAQGIQTAVIGQVAQRNWQTGWANPEDLTGTSKHALSMGNSIVKVDADTSQADKKIANTEKPGKKTITALGDFANFNTEVARATAPGTKYINIVTAGGNTASNPASVGNFYNNSQSGIYNAPASSNPAAISNFFSAPKKYHSGGITPGSPNQEMLAIVRGQERITPLNNERDDSPSVIHIHAEGAIFVGNRGLQQLAEEISRLSNDRVMYSLGK